MSGVSGDTQPPYAAGEHIPLLRPYHLHGVPTETPAADYEHRITGALKNKLICNPIVF